MSSSGFTGRAFIAGIAAWAALAVACGFSAEGQLDKSASPNDPAAGPPAHASVPPSGAPLGPDAGGETSTSTMPCTDPTLSFDGVDDFATVPHDSALDLRGDFTVEAWIKPGAKTTGGAEMEVASHHDASSSNGWAFLVKSGRVEIVVWGWEGISGQGYSAGNSGPSYVVAGKWAHIAGTKEGDMLRVYYDGVLRDTQQIGVFFIRQYYGGAMRIGRAAYVEDFRFQGEIDDLRLSQSARYTGASATKPKGALPVDDDTIAMWHFDEPSGDKLVDTDGKHDGSLAPTVTAPARMASTCIADR